MKRCMKSGKVFDEYKMVRAGWSADYISVCPHCMMSPWAGKEFTEFHYDVEENNGIRSNGWYLVKISVHSEWKHGEWCGDGWSIPEYPTVKHDYQLFEVKELW